MNFVIYTLLDWAPFLMILLYLRWMHEGKLLHCNRLRHTWVIGKEGYRKCKTCHKHQQKARWFWRKQQ